jgi:DNA-binding NarL/FixJ family response regulator
VLSLRFEYGLTISAIARRLERAPKTVREHIEAANEKLRYYEEQQRARKSAAKHSRY